MIKTHTKKNKKIPNVDLVNMNAYIKFDEILSICSQDIEWKRNVDLVNMNAYIKFDEILSICSQDIERKRNYDGMTDNPNSI